MFLMAKFLLKKLMITYYAKSTRGQSSFQAKTNRGLLFICFLVSKATARSLLQARGCNGIAGYWVGNPQNDVYTKKCPTYFSKSDRNLNVLTYLLDL